MRGWEIQWVEDAASGKSLERPGMTYALELLRSGQAQGIVAAKLDRLSRSSLDFASLLERATKEAWNIVLLDLGLDLSTPMGKFTASVMVAVAELEREMISERTKVGLAAAAKKGIHPGPKAGAKPAIPAAESILVMHLTGSTLAEIAAKLNADGVPLPSGRLGVWQPVQVQRIIKRAEGA
jgi:DNA invertase Pin-like site-specific DNA recombinase